jgi:hypothetical protein
MKIEGANHEGKTTQLVIHINRTKYEVTRESLTGRELKELARIPLGDVLFRQQPGEDEVVPNETVIKLKNGDHFHSSPPANYGEGGKGQYKVTVFINRAKYEFEHLQRTGAELKQRASISLTDTLFRDRHGEDEVITNETTVTLKNGDHFHSQPPADYGDGPALAGLEPKRVLRQPNGWTFLVFDFEFGSYRPSKGELLIKLPPLFPTANPDMFWVRPTLVTAAGGAPQAATVMEVIGGEQWQRFSWHMKPGGWRPGVSDLRDFIRCVRARFARGN